MVSSELRGVDDRTRFYPSTLFILASCPPRHSTAPDAASTSLRVSELLHSFTLLACAPVWPSVLTTSAVLLSYLVGSLSPGLFFARIHRVDLRSFGSHHTGATNVARLMGRRIGRVVLLLDMAKGALPCAIALCWPGLGPTCGYGVAPDSMALWAIGLAAPLGHCFPVWHGFRGGKGVATSLGVLIVVAPVAALGGVAAFLGVRKGAGPVSLASLVGALTATTLAVLGSSPPCSAMLAAALLLLILLRHRENISRLLRGTEPSA